MSRSRSKEIQDPDAQSGITILPEVDQLLHECLGIISPHKCPDILSPNAPRLAVPWRQRMYEELICRFSEAAREYVDLAAKIIPCAATHNKDCPAEYHFEKVLQSVAKHVRLLAQLRDSLTVTVLAGGRTPDLAAIQGIIWSISSRLPDQPVLIPVVSSRFVYVHLNYVKNVGIIGVPPYALGRPFPDLPILWHEVAGYLVARQRARGDALKQAQDLQSKLRGSPLGTHSAWYSYRQLYEDSVQQDPRVRLNIGHPSGTTLASIGIADHDRIREYLAHDVPASKVPTVDTDFNRQMHWFGQILEDRFGLEELGETTLTSLTRALSRAYESLDLGNESHPPPVLRLQIAREYLQRRGVTVSTSGTTDPKIVTVAQVIADYLIELYPKQAARSPVGDAVIQAIRGFVDVAFSLPPAGSYTSTQLTSVGAIANAFKDFLAWSGPGVGQPGQLWQMWDRAGYGESKRKGVISGDASCVDPVEAATLLELLRSTRFTETDENTGSVTGRTPPVPPLLLLQAKRGPRQFDAS